MPENKGQPVAAIGIGSNSIRLLIALPGEGTLTPVERLETITWLASYSGDAGDLHVLAGESILNTQAAVVTFAHHAWERGARLLGVIATEAVRTAANQAELTVPLQGELGLPVTVITGEQEAELGWQTISSGYEPGALLGVIDIGGASTDLAAGITGRAKPSEVVSFKAGGRTVTARFKLDHPVSLSELASAIDLLGVEMGPGARGLDPQPRQAVVIGGTASVLAGLGQGSLHAGSRLDAITERSWLENWLLRIAGLEVRERAAAGVPHDRADIIVAGGAILLTILNAWQLDRFYISERNILDGFIERSLNGESLH